MKKEAKEKKRFWEGQRNLRRGTQRVVGIIILVENLRQWGEIIYLWMI